MQARFRTGSDARAETLEYIKARGWPLPPAGSIAALP